jgi:gluconolactonase
MSGSVLEERMGHVVVDSRFLDLMDEHTPVNQIGTGFVFTEGPIWHPTEKFLLFSDMPGDVRRKWTPEGGISEYLRPSNKGNGMTYDAELNLLVCEHATSSVARFRADGTREVLTSHFEGKELNSPNDIVVKSDGSIYFTDPTYGRREHFGIPRPLQQGFQGVYMLPPDHRPGDEAILVSDRYMFTQPNGLCFSPCERWMWVNDTEQANIRMFDVAEDGRLKNGRVFASGIKDPVKAGLPDGMKADINGNVWVTAPGGVWVYSFDGLLIGKVEVPEMVANIHWGGDDWQTLFMCACTSVYSIQTKVRPRQEPFMNPKPSENTSHQPATATNGVLGSSAKGLQLSACPAIDPKKTALLIQDLQNDVMMDGGAFAETGSPQHARDQNVVANAIALAETARRKGIPVIHIWMVCEPGHPHLAQHAPLFQGLKGENALVRGTWGVAPVPGLEKKPGDIVCEKMSMSGWETSRLEAYLRHAGIDTIINTGSWTNMSVEHTARTAADKGFRVIVPEDACSTMSAEWHEASINYAMQNIANVTSVASVISALG